MVIGALSIHGISVNFVTPFTATQQERVCGAGFPLAGRANIMMFLAKLRSGC
jgi:hypothetical protein